MCQTALRTILHENDGLVSPWGSVDHWMTAEGSLASSDVNSYLSPGAQKCLNRIS